MNVFTTQIQNSWTHTQCLSDYIASMRMCVPCACLYLSFFLSFSVSPYAIWYALLFECVCILITVWILSLAHDVASKIVNTIFVYTRLAVQRVRFISYFSLANHLHSVNTSNKIKLNDIFKCNFFRLISFQICFYFVTIFWWLLPSFPLILLEWRECISW